MKIKNDVLICGEKYLGEVLICDFGVEGVEEDKWYVVLKDGEIVEVKEYAAFFIAILQTICIIII